MTAPKFFKVRDPGSAGLDVWPALEARHVAAGTPQQRGLMLHEDAAAGLSVGIWECTAWTGTMGPWSVHEFMILLEGSVSVIDHHERTTTINAGECFLIPKGLSCAWHQTGTVRKIFMIFDDASGAATPAEQRVVRFGGDAALVPAAGPDPAVLVGPAPEVREYAAHTDTTGRWGAGVWAATPYERKVIPFPRAELMHILDGSVTLTHADGSSETAGAGESVFIPAGAGNGWRCAVPVTKVFCGLKPVA